MKIIRSRFLSNALTSIQLLYVFLARVGFLIIGPLLFALLVIHFEDAQMFDRIYLSALLMALLFCLRDPDTAGVVGILCLYMLTAHLQIHLPNEPALKIAIYLFTLVGSVALRQHLLAKACALTATLCCVAEVYWLQSGYANPPHIHYYQGVMFTALLATYCLSNRVEWMFRWQGYLSGNDLLDRQVIILLYIYALLLVCMLLEYFSRHIFMQKDWLIMYNLFSPFVSVLNAITLGAIYIHFFRTMSQRSIKA